MPAERIAPTERVATGLEAETLSTTEAVRQMAKSETEAEPLRARDARTGPEVLRAGEESDLEHALPPAPRTRLVRPPTRAPEAAPHQVTDETPAPQTLSAAGSLGIAPPLPTAVTALDESMAPIETAVPTVEPLPPNVLHQPDARSAAAEEGVRPTAPPVPARLAVPLWLERLAAAGERHVQVGLGDDGSVRLQTRRQADGITVQIHFSDPELQALAGVHADRLRSALETHFAEPVRLSLPDGLASDAGASDSGTSDPDFNDSRERPTGSPSDAHRARTSERDLPSHTPTRLSPNGRREWVG